MTIENGTRLATTPARGLVSRRTLVAGTAWAVPAVIVATAAPALTASPRDPNCSYFFNVNNAATCRSSTGYTFQFVVTRSPQCGSAADALNLSLVAPRRLQRGLGPRCSSSKTVSRATASSSSTPMARP